MKKSLARTVCAIAFLLVFGLLWDVIGTKPEATGRLPGTAGSVRSVRAAYQKWRQAGGDRAAGRLVVTLGWSKALSVERSEAKGRATVDRGTGVVTVEVEGLADRESFDAWLVHNVPGPKRSVRPEPGDEMVRVGALERAGDTANLRANLSPTLARDFDVDLVVLTRSDAGPVEGGVLFGAPTLFQRLAAQERRHPDPLIGEAAPSHGLSFLLGDLAPVPAYAGNTASTALDPLVSEGQQLFFNETFAGNGRTCATCHRAQNNFTIDAKFIATLPPFDPLFVAEFVPALAANFENPVLMRQMGLIKENLDGFDDLANKFVMRGVPHTLALPTSLTPAANGADGATLPPNQRTGWSGDGAPGGGTLREFAIGAVTQHFTLSLGRVPGVDFRLPTDEELDALEAFQLSLGRQEDLDLSLLRLKDPLARRGKALFLATDTSGGTVAAGKCNVCHANAGANLAGAPGQNFNFDTGVEALPDNRADLIAPGQRRPDGGFGRAPHPRIAGAFGNGSFNTPPLVEAADTGPFFHDNVVRTIEEAVAFYNSQAFANSAAGRFIASRDSGRIGIRLEPTQVSAIAAFLRVINALENIREAIELQRGVQAGSATEVEDLTRAAKELGDAVSDLDEVGLHADAVDLLRQAADLTRSAVDSGSCHANPVIDLAINFEEQARAKMAQ